MNRNLIGKPLSRTQETEVRISGLEDMIKEIGTTDKEIFNLK